MDDRFSRHKEGCLFLDKGKDGDTIFANVQTHLCITNAPQG